MPHPTRALLAAGLALCAFQALALPTTSPVLDRIRDTGAVRLAYRENSVPFSYVDGGKPVGYSIDLCSRLVEALKVAVKRADLNIQYVPVTPATRIAAITEGKADLECGSTNNTRERREKVAFTIPHYIASSRMLVKTSSGIHRWEDLNNKTVVSTRGSTNGGQIRAMADARVLKVNVVEARDHTEAFGLVVAGKADAFAMDDVLLYGFRATSPNPADYTVVGSNLAVAPYAIMLSKDDPEFKKVIDLAMSRMILDGEAEKLYKKWFQQPIPPNGVKLEIPMSFLLRDSFKFPTDKVAD
ncbi:MULTISPECIES: amino acid ABC transporter substrate-binding protein [Ralstonia]|uniref:Amino acid ABC transporter substrate-binding protein n=2 Tax=Ralstonia pickettii TaxID=329 RepID=A0A2P4RG93_RALPI|nr:glutamine ABC transporter substrate-binding protein GlnH [Ralstonia sp.]MBA9845942.1 amino acid ABC transporter substrate-binding protein [Ralstonia pickettii]MBA4232498.1 glutamine ABC transporter substrate-binding protein GlnH [Ralstonia sp.]MBA4237493.1 glutamine ABC transporter substrate-binding protein GlnH [Ralstonia sp.]MBA4278695.1 glutamine ABC transporter substrate-binding protein GlnH [Ralstonia sp.]